MIEPMTDLSDAETRQLNGLRSPVFRFPWVGWVATVVPLGPIGWGVWELWADLDGRMGTGSSAAVMVIAGAEVTALIGLPLARGGAELRALVDYADALGGATDTPTQPIPAGTRSAVERLVQVFPADRPLWQRPELAIGLAGVIGLVAVLVALVAVTAVGSWLLPWLTGLGVLSAAAVGHTAHIATRRSAAALARKLVARMG